MSGKGLFNLVNILIILRDKRLFNISHILNLPIHINCITGWYAVVQILDMNCAFIETTYTNT